MTRQEYIKAVKAKLDEISPFDEPGSFIAAEGDSDYDKVKPVVSYIESELDHAAQFCLNTLPLSLLGGDIQSETFDMRVTDDGVGIIDDICDYMRLARLHVGGWQRDVTAFISTSSPLYLLQQNKYTRGGSAKPVVAYNPEEKTLECYSVNDKYKTEYYCYTWAGGTVARMTLTGETLTASDGLYYRLSSGFYLYHTDLEADSRSGVLYRTGTSGMYSAGPYVRETEYNNKLYYIDLRDVRAEEVESGVEDYIVLACTAYVLDILGDVNSSKLMREKLAEKLQSII